MIATMPTVPRRRRPAPDRPTRPTTSTPILGMTPMDFAVWLHGREPTHAELRRVYRIAAGQTDPGLQWLAAVLERMPEADARVVLEDLAERLARAGRG